MNATKAQQTVSAAIGAGYNAQAIVGSNNNWTVVVSPGTSQLDLQAIATFAQNEGITGNLQSVSLV